MLWLERDSDREKMLEDRYRNNRWHQFYIEEWISTEEWIRRVREKGENMRRGREREKNMRIEGRDKEGGNIRKIEKEESEEMKLNKM